MRLRKWLFWFHLVSGVLAGLIIFLMSATGVILAYERQFIAMAEAKHVTPTDGDRLSVDVLWELATAKAGVEAELELVANPKAPVKVFKNRDQLLLHPQTGAILLEGKTTTATFLRQVTALHRWLALKGDSRGMGKAITGAANLLFVFLGLTGLYLWLPPTYRWAQFKLRLFFKRNNRSGQARDFNWHHVFGFWMLIPIVVMAMTALVFSYQWAGNLVYKAYGEDPPERGRRAPDVPPELTKLVAPDSIVPLQTRFDVVTKAFPHWRRISFSAPQEAGAPINFEVDMGNGAQYTQRHEATVGANGTLHTSTRPIEKRTPGSRARIFIRFLHTGEVYGWWGQTLAGLGSLASLFLVWTGFALSYRRLRRFLAKRKTASA